MQTHRRILLTVFLLFFAASAGWAGEHPTKEDVVNFINEALAFAKANGKDVLLAEITKGKDGQFMRGELYLSAYDFDIKVLAHAAKPFLAGKDFSKLMDKKGMLIGEAYVKAINNGTHWIEYYWQNPVSKKMEKKLGYGAKLDDTCWISSGTYAPK